MKNKYKIGDLEKLFGINVQTIRFYESKGFIKPQKNEETGYRYYSNWEINFLLDVIQLKQYGFPLNRIHDILNSESPEKALDSFEKQEAEIVKNIAELQEQLESVHRQKNLIKSIEKSSLEIVQSPQLLFHPYRTRNTLLDFKKDEGETAKWISHLPVPMASFVLIDTDIHPDSDYLWGYSMTIPEAVKRGISSSNNMLLFSKKSIHTVFEAGDENSFMDALIKNILPELQRSGLTITEQPYGRLILRSEFNHKMRRFFEIFIPIE